MCVCVCDLCLLKVVWHQRKSQDAIDIDWHAPRLAVRIQALLSDAFWLVSGFLLSTYLEPASGLQLRCNPLCLKSEAFVAKTMRNFNMALELRLASISFNHPPCTKWLIICFSEPTSMLSIYMYIYIIRVHFLWFLVTSYRHRSETAPEMRELWNSAVASVGIVWPRLVTPWFIWRSQNSMYMIQFAILQYNAIYSTPSIQDLVQLQNHLGQGHLAASQFSPGRTPTCALTCLDRASLREHLSIS